MRSLTDPEYDEIFTAAIQRSFTYSSDEKFLSNDNNRENSTFFDGPDSSSTTVIIIKFMLFLFLFFSYL